LRIVNVTRLNPRGLFIPCSSRKCRPLQIPRGFAQCSGL
jgi:hypothetical protein